MRIVELLNKKSIALNANVSTRDEAIDKLVELQYLGGKIKDKAGYKAAILAREDQGTTAIGEGIMTPHAKSASVSGPSLAAMTVPAGVDCQADDDEPTNIFFIIAAPEGGADVHLEVLSRLMTMLMDEDFRANLLAAKSNDEFLKIIDDQETAKYGAEVKEEKQGGYRVLAVTACPTGIAHTFMAAEALEKAGKKMGYALKAETNGSGGAKNVLTAEEIANCDGIIVAADKAVEMSRFDGKPVLVTKVADGIKKPEELINKIKNGQVPVYHHTGAKAAASSSDDESLGRKIYKHLMNGVSHMLPFVVGGGILIALAFLIDGLLVDLNNIPKELLDKYPAQLDEAGNVVKTAEQVVKSNFGTLTPIADMLKGIGGTAFGFMLPVLAGFIAMSMADRPGLAVGIVGGAIAANGKSGFLGAIVAGFLAGAIIKGLIIATKKLPKAIDGVKTVLIYPLFGILLIGLAMNFAVEPLVGVINSGLNDWLKSLEGANAIILGLILGGMMAIDMGGPFNKAAYLFGTGAIAAGSYNVMAAVMIGGMVPPCAIALSTMIFKKKYTSTERKTAPTNFIMGLSFITEGAIPFAASDPGRVIPSMMVASGIAGALSMAFNCTLMAPHGGIFVFAVVGNWPLYLLALLIGTIVGAALLGIWKKPAIEEAE